LPLGARRQKNSNFFLQPSENPVFSRLFASVILKPYVFSLVFALMSENKGNFLLFTADYLVQQPCGGTLRFPCSVSVDIHCAVDFCDTLAAIFKTFSNIEGTSPTEYRKANQVKF